jgi:hypothetical protein
MEAANKIFLEKYSDAAKVYPYSRASISSEAVRVHSVEGGQPEFFYEAGTSNGIAAIAASVIGNPGLKNRLTAAVPGDQD